MSRAKNSAPRTVLTNDELARAALALIDEEGVEAFSFRKLSAVTGVPTMTIANRFGSKDALMKAALGEMLAENKIEPVTGETWQQSLRRVAHANRSMALAHPKAFMLFVMTPQFESPSLEFTRSVFATHESDTLPAHMPEYFLSLMHSFLTGFQLQEMYVNEHYSGNVPVADGESGDRQRMARMIAGLYDEDAFIRNLEIIIAGFAACFDLPS